MTISEAVPEAKTQCVPSRPRALAGLVAATLLLPLALLLLGLWERQRGADDWAAFRASGNASRGSSRTWRPGRPRTGAPITPSSSATGVRATAVPTPW
jgi:hypothetical protein